MARTGRDFFSKKTWSRLGPLMGLQLLWLISFQFLGLHTVYSLLVLAITLFVLVLMRHRLSENQKIELQLQATVILMFSLSLVITTLFGDGDDSSPYVISFFFTCCVWLRVYQYDNF